MKPTCSLFLLSVYFFAAPDARSQDAKEAEKKAVEALKALGAKVVVDEKKPN